MTTIACCFQEFRVIPSPVRHLTSNLGVAVLLLVTLVAPLQDSWCHRLGSTGQGCSLSGYFDNNYKICPTHTMKIADMPKPESDQNNGTIKNY